MPPGRRKSEPGPDGLKAAPETEGAVMSNLSWRKTILEALEFKPEINAANREVALRATQGGLPCPCLLAE